MSILKIAKMGHPVLFKKADPVSKLPDQNVKKIINDMSETMIDAEGLGLAAPQVHISKQILMFRNPDLMDKEQKSIEITVLINPKITNYSKETEDDWEGCLSIPGMHGLVRRSSKISYEGSDMNGNIIKNDAEGMLARIIQHEFDHLLGIVYTSRLADPRAFGFDNEIKQFWQK